MTYKHLLKFGLPVLLILTVVIVVSLVIGRPRQVPKVTAANTVEVDFETLELTKGDLYKKMKANYGLQNLLEMADRIMLEQYSDLIDEEEIREEIAYDKVGADDDDTNDEEAKETFYNKLLKQGFYQLPSETEAEFEERIFQKYRLDYLKSAAAEARAKSEVTAESLQDAKDKYVEDVCVIPAMFDTENEANTFLSSIENLNGQALKDKFIVKWNEANDDTDEEEDEDEDYLVSQFDCDYERLVYTDMKAGQYREYAFKTLAEGEYNDSSFVLSGKYYVIYKEDVAPAKSTYDQDKFEDALKDRLIQGKINSSYIIETLAKVRKDEGLKIHDPLLADQYEKTTDFFKEYTKHNDKKVVASFGDNEITADELYDLMKIRFGVAASLDKVTYEALRTIEQIRFTKKEKEEKEDYVANVKKQFINLGYGQYFSWSEYINTYFGATSEKELIEILMLNDLEVRYILGHEDFEGVYPITDDEIEALRAKWFVASASHILFKNNYDGIGEATDEDKETARKLADQVLNGVKASNRLADGENIMYNDEEFIGLKNTPAADLPTVFAALAKEYSQDGSASKGGALGEFGPGSADQKGAPIRMVEEFEEAVLATQEGKVHGEIVETTYGFHVIYVTEKTTADKPANYDDLSEDEIQEIIEEGSNEQVERYYTLMNQFEEQVKAEHLATGYKNKYLAQLRNTLGFEFEDATLQAHYAKLNALDLDFPKEENE